MIGFVNTILSNWWISFKGSGSESCMYWKNEGTLFVCGEIKSFLQVQKTLNNCYEIGTDVNAICYKTDNNIFHSDEIFTSCFHSFRFKSRFTYGVINAKTDWLIFYMKHNLFERQRSMLLMLELHGISRISSSLDYFILF